MNKVEDQDNMNNSFSDNPTHSLASVIHELTTFK